MRRRQKSPPSPLRWNPPAHSRSVRRRGQKTVGIAVLVFVLVTGAGTALTFKQKHGGDGGGSFVAAASPHDALNDSASTSAGSPPDTRAVPAAIFEKRYDALPREAFTCTVASITDGDTLRCAEEDANGRQIRVRISGIDAREKDGSCAPGHPCASAPPEVATAELARLADGQVLTCKPAGETYGRVAAWCSRADGTDVSCAMMASGTVARWWKYWGLHRC